MCLRVSVRPSVRLSVSLPHRSSEPHTVTADVFALGTRLLVSLEPAEAWQGLRGFRARGFVTVRKSQEDAGYL